MEARVVSLRTGCVTHLPRPEWERHRGATWRSAYVKSETNGPVRVTTLGLEGDEQFDRRVHGGPDRALLAYAGSHYAKWRAETGLDAMGPGGFGENLTLAGVDESSVCLGDRWTSGDVGLEVSQPRGPCANISRRWNHPRLLELSTQLVRIGWYLRVRSEGALAGGATMQLASRPHPEWTIERIFRLRLEPGRDPDGVRWLSASGVLTSDWRGWFATRAARAP
ncbi:MAG TPA: MOSC domain-containing protein [Candidatus Acidoferrales bacterium]|nr:MOSC domain-containing protein [Candidatus Acidoferrales bacterium]